MIAAPLPGVLPSRRPLAALALSLAALVLSCAAMACDAALPPLPEIVVVVDTDLPVPLAASRLRIDVYTEQGEWFESADLARPDPRDWPVSFSLYSEDPTRSRRVWVRVRTYLDGHTRDYRGERPHDEAAPSDPVPGAKPAPRLVVDGEDLTPPTEPEPLVTVDRLALLELEPDRKRRVLLLLRGDCLGRTARFGADPTRLVAGEAKTCVDAERADVDASASHATPAEPGLSSQGTWLTAPPCPPPAAASARVCVRGSATVLGTKEQLASISLATTPVRVFGLTRFFIDRGEVTVGGFRAALERGFSPPSMPRANDGPLGAGAQASCAWSTDPLDRENHSLNCVSWSTARAFCQSLGGDLPSEAQWEHAATVAGHAAKHRYPSGNEDPDCDGAAFGRVVVGAFTGECVDKGPLPPPPEDSARDLSPLGIGALGAGLSEWVLDMPAPYTEPCWTGASLVDPRCGDPEQDSPNRALRGANYVVPEMVPATTRFFDDASGLFSPVGFRCVYPEPDP